MQVHSQFQGNCTCHICIETTKTLPLPPRLGRPQPGQARARARRAPPRGGGGEGEPGPAWRGYGGGCEGVNLRAGPRGEPAVRMGPWPSREAAQGLREARERQSLTFPTLLLLLLSHFSCV